MPEISIIIPVYQVEKYLRKCMDSVVTQTFRDYEVILIDDGSKDDCPALCDEYARNFPNLITVVHQENAGLSSTRNRGLEMARGRYVLFVDSDDSIHPEMLERLYSAAASLGFPDMVMAASQTVDENGRRLDIRRNGIPSGAVISAHEHRELLITHNEAWGRIVKREIYMKHNLRFPVGLWYEDLCLTPKITLKCETVAYVDIPLYNYLIREGSIMTTVNLEKMADMFAVLDDLLRYYREDGAFSRFKEELEYLALYQLAFRASLKVIRADYRHPMLGRIGDFMKGHFGNYLRNEYFRKLPVLERIFIRAIYYRCFGAVFLLLRAKDAVVKR